ncbi:hypothetical protein N7488_007989 [Penicillium malachiteum]|nr:hypothetical protein N7488_007989 [Penicillium malachiteum]
MRYYERRAFRQHEQLTGQDADQLEFGKLPPPAGVDPFYISSDSDEREHLSTVHRPKADPATLSNDRQQKARERAKLYEHTKYHRKKMKRGPAVKGKAPAH